MNPDPRRPVPPQGGSGTSPPSAPIEDDILAPLRPAPEYPRDKVMRAAAAELMAFQRQLVEKHQLTAAELMKLNLVVADHQANLLCWAERSGR